jgi:hypothetical protein
MRHSTNEATKKIAPELGLGVVGAVFGGTLGGQALAMAGQFAVGSAFLKYSRNAESEADQVGSQIMYDAGYDPYQLALFFAKLDEESGSRGSQFFSDHPNPGNRSQAIRTEIAQFPQKQFTTDSPEFDHIHQLAMQERTYSAKEIQSGNTSGGEGGRSGSGKSGRGGRGQNQGEDQEGDDSVRGGNAPSPVGQFQTFAHSAYSIRYPNDWQLHGDSQSSVTISPSNGITNNAVAYGAIINDFQPENPTSIDDSTHQLVETLRQSNQALRTIGNDEEITVNGVKGRSVDMIGQSPLADRNSGQPDRERDWLVALPRQDGSVVYVVFIAPDKDFMNLRPTFEQMLRSLHLK